MPRISTSQEKGSGNRAAPATLRLLSLAAAPTFTVMAVLSAIEDGGAALCSAQHASPLTGMAAMYALMSLFHLAPWIRLISSWRRVRTLRRISIEHGGSAAGGSFC